MTTRKIALVTGAGRGIGLGIAKCLAKDGANIAILDVHEESAVSDSLKELQTLGAEVLYVQGDVTKSESRKQCLEAILTKWNRIDVLVNNAGVAPKVRADILEATEESYEWVMKINLQGPYFLTQLIANQMIKQRKQDQSSFTCIINISSVSSTVASPSRGEYCISKAGVSMATSLWAARLGEYDIPVYEIRPGIIKTDMTAAVTEKYDKLIAEGLLRQKRWGLPEDIGKAAASLARGDMAYSTGQVIMVDGGQTVAIL